jgi:hypothetical protein
MPENITLSAGTELSDQKLRNIANRVVKQAELAMEKVAANYAQPSRFPLPPDTGSIEYKLKTRFDKLRPDKKDVAVRKVLQRLVASPEIRKKRFGDLVSVALTTAKSIEEQVKVLPYPQNLKINKNTLTAFKGLPSLTYVGTTASGLVPPPVAPPVDVVPTSPAAPPADLPAVGVPTSPAAPPANYNNLTLRVHRVTCVDETDGLFGSEAGEDEIDLGGTRILPNGQVEKINSQTVREDFDDGESQEYNPPWSLTIFNLTTGIYTVSFILAEIDNGGLPDLLNDIVDGVKKKIGDEVEAAVNEQIDDSTIAAAIAALVVLVFTEIWRLFKNIWEDDLFSPYTVTVSVPSLTAGFNGNSVSPQGVASFDGHGGKYEVLYDWQVSV